ncbi:type VI secretion protein [Brevundimonas sp.]|uniref:type VI secretion protein n=1 Tax=Brevundimonas sp. TaxID=1871086 RepID=UPI0028A1E17B|nr:type VI secretion protein [Brevundimonas sp.]
MLVRDHINERLRGMDVAVETGPLTRLPRRLKGDPCDVRTSLLMRLATSRLFAYGDRAGALRTAQKRSGRAFRLDVRQRVIVKVLVSRHMGKGAARIGAILAHVAYIGRDGAGAEGARAVFFNREEGGLDGRAVVRAWGDDRHHFRLIISPEHGDRIRDLPDYVRDVMGRIGADLGEPELQWFATCHHDTDQPHAHVLVRGRRANGRDLVMPRDYVGYGLRARAQEAAEERLGSLARMEAEQRVWRETQRDAFTALDRRLLQAQDSVGMVDDAAGTATPWAALTRGRLAHLEGLGLAERRGRRFRLADDLEGRLRRLQISKDVIRTINQRRFETGRTVDVTRPGRLKGLVMKAGLHDEIGASPWVIMRDAEGLEHYARLHAGSVLPKTGSMAVLDVGEQGIGRLASTLSRALSGPAL